MSIISEINKNPLDFINKLVKGVVNNLINNQIYKKVIDVDNKTVQYVYNVDTLMELQYKKYHYPSDKEGEYYEINKDEYCLAMFRLINVNVYGIEISDILQRMININITKDNIPFISSIKHKMNKDEINKMNYCTYELIFYKVYNTDNNKDNNKESNKKISINIPKHKFDTLIKKYTDNMKLKYSDYYYDNISTGKINILETLLYKEKIKKYHTNVKLSFYLYYEDYIKNNKTKIKKENYDKDVCFIFYSFLLFLIESCNNNYLTMTLRLHSDIKDKKNTVFSGHANKIILQIIKDINNKEKVLGIQYEPHGSENGYSYNEYKIDEYFKEINRCSIQCKQINSDFPEFVINDKVAVCPKGIQSSENVGKYDIGYCSIFSLFWHNCFIDIIQNIKRIENKYNINTLSSIDIQLWINSIDKNLINYKNINLKYGDKMYGYDILLNVFQSVFKEHYKKYNISKVFGDFDEYIQLVNIYFEDEFIDGVEDITITEFIDMYYDNVLLEVLRKQLRMNNDDIQNISNNRYKMSNIEYYNIFVNYAYNMLSFILSSPYLEKEREMLNLYSQKNYFIDILKNNKNLNIVNRSEDEQYKTDKYIHDLYLEDYDNMFGNMEYNKQYKEYASEQMNEIEELIDNLPKKYKKKIGEECTSNKDCGNKLICDEFNQCNINYNKQFIGDNCEEDDDCYSEYCDNKICRKYVHNVPNISSDEEFD
jgi:hypothetical protein